MSPPERKGQSDQHPETKAERQKVLVQNEAGLREKKGELQEKFAELQAKIAELQLEKNDQSNQYPKTKGDLQKKLIEKEAELRKKKENLQGLVAELQRKAAELQKKEEEHMSKDESQQAESAEISKDLESMKNELKNFKQEIAALKEQFAQFRKAVEEKLVLPMKPQDVLAETQPKVAAAIEPTPKPSVKEAIAGKIRVLDLKTIPVALQIPSTLIPHDQPFLVQLTLDLTNSKLEKSLPIECKISVYAKKLGDGFKHKQVLADHLHKKHSFADKIQVDGEAKPLSRGTYRLTVVADLTQAEKGTGPQLISMGSGDIDIQVS